MDFSVCSDDDEEPSAPVDQEEEEEEEGDGEKDKVTETEASTRMEEETGEELDPLDAYMEEVKEEVKKFNMGTMKGGNDKVRKQGLFKCVFIIFILFNPHFISNVRFYVDTKGDVSVFHTV